MNKTQIYCTAITRNTPNQQDLTALTSNTTTISTNSFQIISTNCSIGFFFAKRMLHLTINVKVVKAKKQYKRKNQTHTHQCAVQMRVYS